MATIDIGAPDVEFRQRSRAERQRHSQIERAKRAAPNPASVMTLSERQAEREVRRRRAPQVRAAREVTHKATVNPLRKQLAELTQQVEALTKQQKGK